MKNIRSQIFKIINPVLFFIYPLIIYFLLTRYSIRVTGIALLLVFSLNYGSRIISHREALKPILVQIFSISCLIILSIVYRHPDFILQIPAIINVFFLVQFAVTLVKPPVMIERIARAFVEDMKPGEQDYAKKVTVVWVCFFVINLFVIEGIIFFSNIKIWTLYTGLIAYVLMGLLFVGEYILRKIKFRRFGDNIFDRLIKKCIPDTECV